MWQFLFSVSRLNNFGIVEYVFAINYISCKNQCAFIYLSFLDKSINLMNDYGMISILLLLDISYKHTMELEGPVSHDDFFGNFLQFLQRPEKYNATVTI